MTIRIRGAGGAVFEVDPPAPGSPLAQQIESGQVVVLPDPKPVRQPKG